MVPHGYPQAEGNQEKPSEQSFSPPAVASQTDWPAPKTTPRPRPRSVKVEAGSSVKVSSAPEVEPEKIEADEEPSDRHGRVEKSFGMMDSTPDAFIPAKGDIVSSLSKEVVRHWRKGWPLFF